MSLFSFRKKSKIPPLGYGKGTPPAVAMPRVRAVYRGPGTLKRIGLYFAHLGLGKNRSSFIQNLAMMLGAGLHVTDAIETLAKEAPSAMRKIINNIF